MQSSVVCSMTPLQILSSSSEFIPHITNCTSWPKGYFSRSQSLWPVCEITSSPSGVDSTSPNVLWDSRPLRLSTVCHFLPGIRGLVISLPIVLARQWPTWLQRSSVHSSVYGHMVVPRSAHVHFCHSIEIIM